VTRTAAEVARRKQRLASRILVVAIAATCVATISTPGGAGASGAACGYWRWPVKVASDADRYRVNTTPQATSVDYLRSLSAPSQFGSLAQDHRIAWPEYRTWVIRHTHLVAYRIEDDGDIHLILRSRTGHEMIAEIPQPSCAGGSRFYSSIAAVRNAFDAREHPATDWHDVDQTIDLRGVGFFDEEHRVDGQAPNGLELHPVTGIWWP